ncbi:MAG: hypothetical protein AABZ14_04545, partial [Candidatus Margulisiibacteriota bacterium]
RYGADKAGWNTRSGNRQKNKICQFSRSGPEPGRGKKYYMREISPLAFKTQVSPEQGIGVAILQHLQHK